MRRQTVVSLFAENPAFGEGDPNWTTTSIKNVGSLEGITYYMEGDYEDASIVVIPKGHDQIVIARGNTHGRTATINGIRLNANGSLKVRASVRQGCSVQIRAVLSVTGTDNFSQQFEYGSAGVG